MRDPGCPFCDIAADPDGHDHVVYANRLTVVFRPLNPYVPGHLLVAPREHVPDATHAGPHIAAAVFSVAARYLRGDGNILTSVGAAATQSVPHLHVHVLPRGPEDGLSPDWPWRRPEKETP